MTDQNNPSMVPFFSRDGEIASLTQSGIWTYEPSTGLECWSPPIYSILDVSPDTPFRSLLDRLRPLHAKLQYALSADEKEFDGTLVHTLENGQKRRLAFRAEIRHVDDAGTGPLQVRGMLQDLTRFQPVGDAMKATLTQLRHEEDFSHLFSSLLDSIQDGIFITDLNYIIRQTNKALEQTYPYCMPMVGKPCYKVFNVADVCPGCTAKRMFETGQKETLIHPETCYEDREPAWLEHSSHPFLDPRTGEIVGSINMIRDISVKVENERQLKEYSEHLEKMVQDRTNLLHRSELQLRAILENSAACIGFCDRDGNLTYTNVALLQYFGYEQQEMLGRSLSLFLDYGEDDEEPSVKHERERFFSGQVAEFKSTAVKIKTKSGVSVWGDICASSQVDQETGKLFFVVVITDVTERTEAQESLRRQEALSRAFNTAARLLLTGNHDFQGAVHQTLELLCKTTKADGAYVWHVEPDIHGTEQGVLGYVWGASQPLEEWNFDALFNERSDQPLLNGLKYGESVNSPVSELNERSRDYLSGLGIVSILIVPIFMEGRFWGFIGLDDFHRSRRWSRDEDDILRNGGLLLATAIRYQAILDELRESDKRFKDTIAATGELLWEHDLEGCFTYLSERFFDFTGWRPEEFIGRSMAEFVHPDDIGHAKTKLADLIAGKTEALRGFDFRGLHVDGTYTWFRVTAIVLRDEHGNPRSFRGTTGDVQVEIEAKDQLHQTLETLASINSELERSTREARRLAQKAEQANIAKSRFLANMSHEIRTPMNGVIGLADLLANESLTKKQAGYVHHIQSSAKSLLAIINDVLDVSKIESGKFELSSDVFCPLAILDNVCNAFSFDVAEKNLLLHREFSPDVPRSLIGDSGRFRQVLYNILGNAIKFTKEGRITIRCRAEPGEQVCRLFCEIEDTGIGIPKEFLPELFNPFAQADASVTRQFGGTGLGLAIVKKLVAMMGGEIEVDSEVGRGSLFRFFVQYVLPDAAEPVSIHEPPQEAKAARTLRILLVEDVKINILVATQTIGGMGHEVVVAENGEQALEALRRYDFDLVLMDCQMPVMDGYQATRRLRDPASGVRNPDITVIAMTANAMSGDREKCLEVGMNDYISKPIDRDTLFKKLEQYA